MHGDEQPTEVFAEDGLDTLRIVEAGEAFLNNCTDSSVPLAAQPQRLLRLSGAVYQRPTYGSVWEWLWATVHLEDLDNDGFDELVLHTQVSANIDAGISVVFWWDSQLKSWRGTAVWPCCGAEPFPMIAKLPYRDSQGYPFVLVTGRFFGADRIDEVVRIWRWKDDGPELALETWLNGWCNPIPDWEVLDEGILVHAVDTYRWPCPSSPAVLYTIQNDEFAVHDPLAIEGSEDRIIRVRLDGGDIPMGEVAWYWDGGVVEDVDNAVSRSMSFTSTVGSESPAITVNHQVCVYASDDAARAGYAVWLADEFPTSDWKTPEQLSYGDAEVDRFEIRCTDIELGDSPAYRCSAVAQNGDMVSILRADVVEGTLLSWQQLADLLDLIGQRMAATEE